MKAVYPFIMMAGKIKKGEEVENTKGGVPAVPFHSLSVTLNNGKPLSFESLKGKKVLLVNTASNCGYTAQYAELQKLYTHSREDLEIIAFPANDFKEQESGSDEAIAQFCAVNFGVGFPLAKKSVVVKAQNQHPVFGWLTNASQNGWNGKAPEWNFSKYLVNEYGVLTHYFPPSVSPTSDAVLAAVNA